MVHLQTRRESLCCRYLCLCWASICDHDINLLRFLHQYHPLSPPSTFAPQLTFVHLPTLVLLKIRFPCPKSSLSPQCLSAPQSGSPAQSTASKYRASTSGPVQPTGFLTNLKTQLVVAVATISTVAITVDVVNLETDSLTVSNATTFLSSDFGGRP